MPLVLVIIGILGVGVTFAEPAIGGSSGVWFISGRKTGAIPFFEVLNNWTVPLVLIVGAGVGLAAIFGTLRFVYGWSLKPLIFFALTPAALLTVYFWTVPDLRSVLGLAWDCGAVTTVITCTISFGNGYRNCQFRRKRRFNLVWVRYCNSRFTLSGYSSFAFDAVCLFSDFAGGDHSQRKLSKCIGGIGRVHMGANTSRRIVLGVRAILPLVIFLFLVLYFILKVKLSNKLVTIYGLILCIVGMCIFNLGLTYGLGAIGTQTGQALPGAFIKLPIIESSPIFTKEIGIALVIGFALLLGFGATLAEPALNALGLTVQKLTNGAFKKSMLMYSVASGVSVGISLGVAKLVLNLDLALILLPLYGVGVVLTVFSSEEFVNVAWDSAGVTTGPVTVPLVLAMGLGLGSAVSAVEGFGILSQQVFVLLLRCSLWVLLFR